MANKTKIVWQTLGSLILFEHTLGPLQKSLAYSRTYPNNMPFCLKFFLVVPVEKHSITEYREAVDIAKHAHQPLDTTLPRKRASQVLDQMHQRRDKCHHRAHQAWDRTHRLRSINHNTSPTTTNHAAPADKRNRTTNTHHALQTQRLYSIIGHNDAGD